MTLVPLITMFFPELGSSVHLSWIKYLGNQVKDMVGIEILYFILKEEWVHNAKIPAPQGVQHFHMHLSSFPGYFFLNIYN